MRARISASALRPTVAEALTAADEAAGRMRTALALFGVDGTAIATTGVSLGPEQVWDGGEGPRTTGYRADHALLVTVRNLAALGPALNAALRAGDADAVLHGLEFTVSDQAPLRARARELAWADARARAEHLAGLAGRRLGAAEDITEGAPGGPGIPVGARAAMVASAVADPAPVGVQVVLTVRWELR